MAYVALLLAACVYIFFREPNTYFAFLIKKICNIQLHNFAPNYMSDIFIFLVFSLPSGLWVMANTIFGYSFGQKRGIFIYLPITLVLTIEFFQLVGITDGTFDYLDVLVSVLGFYVAKKWGTSVSNPPKRWYFTYIASLLAIPFSDVM
ncbi:MAG: hypothetical protein OHK0045_13290 [Raineya sp.]